METAIEGGRVEGYRESSIFKEIHFITGYVLTALFVFCSVVPFFIQVSDAMRLTRSSSSPVKCLISNLESSPLEIVD